MNILKFGLECLKKEGWEFHINIFNNNKTKHNVFQNNEGISKRVPLQKTIQETAKQLISDRFSNIVDTENFQILCYCKSQFWQSSRL